ncbi:hypothetical protein E1301_Tti000712 [Triplophysa tibetana]|uniref:FISNA domain-containing protein n=1 Tax=Triplophysa tibetana TaxID=1572043 RepID=A0A5A9N6N9_9TELE|nr:hypothetical protein E1301_Tti000712 [Triplophysa tibetana]
MNETQTSPDGGFCTGCRPVLTEPVCRKLEHQSHEDFNEDMCAGFSQKSKLTEVLNIFRSKLRQKFECLCEGTSQQRNPTLLNEIFTELYITESESGEISNEHEKRRGHCGNGKTCTIFKGKCLDRMWALFKGNVQPEIGLAESMIVIESAGTVSVSMGVTGKQEGRMLNIEIDINRNNPTVNPQLSQNDQPAVVMWVTLFICLPKLLLDPSQRVWYNGESPFMLRYPSVKGER